MPNSNSWTNPVTTPMATLMSNKVPKNLVSRLKVGLSLRYQLVWSSATKKASPMVTGTNKKW